jgi:hypothetical protein
MTERERRICISVSAGTFSAKSAESCSRPATVRGLSSSWRVTVDWYSGVANER